MTSRVLTLARPPAWTAPGDPVITCSAPSAFPRAASCAALSPLLRLVGHSQSVLDVLAFYNVAAFFGDPLVIPAHDSA